MILTSIDDLSRAGVYMIKLRRSDSFYIGSAVNIGRRWKEHRESISKGTHHNIKIQNAGRNPDDWKFTVIEFVDDVSRLRQREMEWIAIKRPNLNIVYPTQEDVDTLPIEQTAWLNDVARIRPWRADKECEVCGGIVGRSTRYCNDCAQIVLDELESTGYFVEVPPNRHEKPEYLSKNKDFRYFQPVVDERQIQRAGFDDEANEGVRGLFFRHATSGYWKNLRNVARKRLRLSGEGTKEESATPDSTKHVERSSASSISVGQS